MTIYLDSIPRKGDTYGRGVFASKEFKKGEVIEVCPVVIIPKEQVDTVDGTVLTDYVFEWGEKEDETAICFGYGSLYNHSEDPNAEFDVNLKNHTIIFTALRDIKKGEEICTDYGWELTDKKTPEWFKNGKANSHK